MGVSAENPAFETPLIGFPEHKNFMYQPLLSSIIYKIKNYEKPFDKEPFIVILFE
ncbi:hypothetical protein ML435_03050 [Staphylococcus roterodami]|nr:hypothetical protein ML435_03050 [Staphylococcus roterodami]